MSFTGRTVFALAALILFSYACLHAQDGGTRKNTTSKEIAVTFDDLPSAGRAIPLARIQAMTRKLVTEISAAGIPAVGFVNEERLYRAGEMDERVRVLRIWTDAGLELGNHTFSHPSLHTVSLQIYEEDLLRGETVTRMLMEEKGGKLRYFRHPFLRTGLSLDVRERFHAFLKDHGYTVAPVTVDNSDYMFSAIYSAAKTDGDTALMQRIGEAYTGYMGTMVDFFEGVSQELLGRQVKHILLLHANELNAAYFSGVAGQLKQRGYGFITLEDALNDSAYALPDPYTGKGGISWLHRWTEGQGKKMRLRDEPEPPGFVMELYNKRASTSK